MGFFTTNFATAGYNSASNASFQGQLSSSYTTAINQAVIQNADYVGFLYHASGASIEDAMAVVDAIKAGSFSLTDLFGAAQSKAGPVAGSAISDPEPKVVVNGVTIDISGMLSGLDTESWKDSGKNGQNHTREFYTDTKEPAGYVADWANPPKPNEAPTATALHINATETASTYDNTHHITNGDPDLKIIDLRDGGADPDGDSVTTSGYKSFGSDGVTEIDMPSYILIVGDSLIIDQNDRALDDLKAGDHIKLTLTYDIDDGHGHTVSNTAYIDIEGTLDQYKASASGYVEDTHLRSDSTTGGGNINGNILELAFGVDGFDFTPTGGKFTATRGGLTGNEKVTLSDGDTLDIGGAINLDAGVPTKEVALSAAVLSDGKVDYNVGFNGQADATDSVTVGVKYDYDYWYLA